MRAVLFTEATLYKKAVLFIYWSYTVYEGRIIYLLELHCIWRPCYLFTADTL